LEDRARTGAPLRVPRTARQNGSMLRNKKAADLRWARLALRLATGLPNPFSFETAQL
jgi:hypothetical protein